MIGSGDDFLKCLQIPSFHLRPRFFIPFALVSLSTALLHLFLLPLPFPFFLSIRLVNNALRTSASAAGSRHLCRLWLIGLLSKCNRKKYLTYGSYVQELRLSLTGSVVPNFRFQCLDVGVEIIIHFRLEDYIRKEPGTLSSSPSSSSSLLTSSGAPYKPVVVLQTTTGPYLVLTLLACVFLEARQTIQQEYVIIIMIMISSNRDETRLLTYQ